MIEPNPITYRMLFEHYGARSDAFGNFVVGPGAIKFRLTVDPDTPVACNCAFDAGHEPDCLIVLAMQLRREMNRR